MISSMSMNFERRLNRGHRYITYAEVVELPHCVCRISPSSSDDATTERLEKAYAGRHCRSGAVILDLGGLAVISS